MIAYIGPGPGLSMGAALAGLILTVLLAVLPIYIVPTIVAWYRGHERAAAITALNLLLGWTFLGWIAALVWALKDDMFD